MNSLTLNITHFSVVSLIFPAAQTPFSASFDHLIHLPRRCESMRLGTSVMTWWLWKEADWVINHDFHRTCMKISTSYVHWPMKWTYGEFSPKYIKWHCPVTKIWWILLRNLLLFIDVHWPSWPKFGISWNRQVTKTSICSAGLAPLRRLRFIDFLWHFWNVWDVIPFYFGGDDMGCTYPRSWWPKKSQNVIQFMLGNPWRS